MKIAISWAYEQTFFPLAQKNFPLSNPNNNNNNKPKKTKIRLDIFSEIKERKESSSIFVVWEWIYNVKFNMIAQTWLYNHYWLFLAVTRGGLGPKGCVGHTLMCNFTKLHHSILFCCRGSEV